MAKQINSEMIYTVHNKKFGIIGYLVIDRLVCGGSFGGVRIVPDISLYELQSVARSMTYKNAFIHSKIGGAKAAIIINKENEKYKNDILFGFGEGISHFVRAGMFLPVLDMGISLKELQIILDGARSIHNTKSWKDMSHEYTAYSCYCATLGALEKRNIPINDVTFAVQGFGRVGSTYASLMYKAGARLTAFSNKYCGLVDENGFNVDELVQEKLAKGDDFILEQPKDKQISHDSVLEKNVTVLLPAADALVINDENYKRINADIIICAANAPMSREIERLLFENGKIVITDFVANCGGTFGSIMDHYVTKDIILNILYTSYKRKIEKILSQSIYYNRAFVDIVIEEVEKRIDTNYNDVHTSKRLTEHILYLFSNSVSPIKKIINGYMSKKYIQRYEMLWN